MFDRRNGAFAAALTTAALAAAARGDDAKDRAAPTDLKAALAALDLRTFPMPEGAGRATKTAAGSHFSLEKGKASEVAAFQRKTLTALGWTEIDDPQTKFESEDGAQLFFRKDGFLLYASIGVTPADRNVNSGLFFVGNVDAGLLPRFPDAKVVNATPARVILETDAGADAIRAFYRKAMEGKGWKHYYEPQPAGYPDDVVKEIRSKEIRFLHNAVGVTIQMTPQAGKTRLYVSAELQAVQFPVPADAANLEFRSDPPYLFCRTAMTPEKAVALYEKEMKALGFAPGTAAAPDDKGIRRLRCELKGEPPLEVSCLPIDKGSAVEIRQAKALPTRRKGKRQ